jgi:POT family proton-dependent oligopeptide transporter
VGAAGIAGNEETSAWRSVSMLRWPYWVCVLAYVFAGTAYYGGLNILTLFLGHAVHMTDHAASLAVSVYTGAISIAAVALGPVIDRLGVRRAILVAFVLSIATRALLAAAPALPGSTGVACAALVLMALPDGVFTSAVYAGVKQATNKETSSIGFALLYGLFNGGIVVESFASSIVRQREGVVGVYWMCVGIAAAYLVVHFAAFPRGFGGPVAADPSRPRRSWRSGPLANPRFLYFIFILLAVRTLFAHQWLTMPDYVTRAYAPEVGRRFEWVNGLNPLIILVGTPLVAAFTKKIDVLSMMIVGTLVSAASTFLLAPGPSLVMLLAYEVVFSIGEAIWSSRFYEWVTEVAPPDQVGTYMGAATIPWFLAKATTGLYSGWMLERFCPPTGPQHTGTMWLVYGCIALISPVGLILARGWLRGGLSSEGPR